MNHFVIYSMFDTRVNYKVPGIREAFTTVILEHRSNDALMSSE